MHYEFDYNWRSLLPKLLGVPCAVALLVWSVAANLTVVVVAGATLLV